MTYLAFTEVRELKLYSFERIECFEVGPNVTPYIFSLGLISSHLLSFSHSLSMLILLSHLVSH